MFADCGIGSPGNVSGPCSHTSGSGTGASTQLLDAAATTLSSGPTAIKHVGAAVLALVALVVLVSWIQVVVGRRRRRLALERFRAARADHRAAARAIGEVAMLGDDDDADLADESDWDGASDRVCDACGTTVPAGMWCPGCESGGDAITDGYQAESDSWVEDVACACDRCGAVSESLVDVLTARLCPACVFDDAFGSSTQSAEAEQGADDLVCPSCGFTVTADDVAEGVCSSCGHDLASEPESE